MQIKIPIELPDNFCEIVAENLIKKGDAVLVTRCKDCKCYINEYGTNKLICDFWSCEENPAYTAENDFCSYAEPKESEDKKQ